MASKSKKPGVVRFDVTLHKRSTRPSRGETIFIPGERVRLWKRAPITRKDGSEEIASKLKLFNRVYEVVGRSGTRYELALTQGSFMTG